MCAQGDATLRADDRTTVLERLPHGTRLEYLGGDATWASVRAPDGTRGWVLRQWAKISCG